jgi:hypothetical protein
MLVTNYKVFVTKNGDGSITYTRNKMNYKVFISKENEVLKEVFDNYYDLLNSFKNRHYAIAKWIVRDIRAEGYVFKAYANNNFNIRPVKEVDAAVRVKTKAEYEQYVIDNMHRRKREVEVLDFERFIH